jgi:hypothetical protein
MADIVHRVRVHAPRAEVHRAVCDEALRAVFWPKEALQALRVKSAQDATQVAYRFEEGPPELRGTDIVFDVVGDGTETVLRFRHRNWRETTDFMADCATTWARMLLGMKAHLETPEAEDVLL